MICRATPYEGKEPYIFISYCHADKSLIYPLIEQMSLDGYRVWYDVGNKPGINWLRNIEDHLENSKVVIAFISKHSSDSNNCNKEIVYAMKCEKKVIPILIETVALPRGLRMQMVDLHYLERKDFPSDKELLKKTYEAEECKECRDPSGSIPLRSDDSVRPQDSSNAGGIGWFINNMNPLKREKKNDAEPKPEPKPMPQTEVHTVPKPMPQPEPKTMFNPAPQTEPKPEPITEADPHTITHVEAPVEEDYDEATYIPSFGLSGEATVYGDSFEEGTVLNGHVSEFDDDQTVRISRNLAILLHPAEQKVYKLKSPKITIGRSKINCDVVIEGNDSISKVHAFIRQSKQKCFIEDANSANGTFVNGEQIEPKKQVPLDNPAIFQLNDETLILLSGLLARKFDKKTSIALLINEEATAVRIMDSDTLALNRNNKWQDGTLSDPKVHRAGHGLLCQRDDGIYLIDESPEKGNGTYLNGTRMRHGTQKRLSSGDQIRLGDTTLEFISMEIPS